MRIIIIISTLILTSVLANCQVINLSVDSMLNFSKFKYKTIELKSFIHDSTDCGEWGGHAEHFRIYESEGTIWISFERDSTDCEEVAMFKKSKITTPMEYSKALSKKKQEYVKTYINELINHRSNIWRSSNAPNSYEVHFSDGLITYGFTIHDKDTSWKKYELFREKIIK